MTLTRTIYLRTPHHELVLFRPHGEFNHRLICARPRIKTSLSDAQAMAESLSVLSGDPTVQIELDQPSQALDTELRRARQELTEPRLAPVAPRGLIETVEQTWREQRGRTRRAQQAS